MEFIPSRKVWKVLKDLIEALKVEVGTKLY